MGAEIVRLLELPHHDAKRLLRSGAPVWFNFNPIEFHGPHLPLACDRLIGRGILHELLPRVAARFPDWPILLVEDCDVGAEPTCGPGSSQLGYRQVRCIVHEMCNGLVAMGARRAVLSTFHGSFLHNLALEEGARIFRNAGGQAVALFHVVMNELIHLDVERFAPAFAHVADEEERAAMHRSMRLDFHGGFFETCLALRYAGDSVSSRHLDVPPCPHFGRVRFVAFLSRLAEKLGWEGAARELDFLASASAWIKLRPFPGYTGRPHRATAQSGAFFAERILERYEETLVSVFDDGEPPPLPAIGWMKTVSLGGRLRLSHVPLQHVLSDLFPPAD